VIGTAWKGLEVGAKVYFVYNNPDDVLCQHVTRSREVIEEKRIEKINLTTGPMAITGSTRMQATTIQLCVLLTVLEMALRRLLSELEPGGPCALEAKNVPASFLKALEQMHAELNSAKLRGELAQLVALEESVYRAGRKNNYFADRFGIDVLTDTTERSPTYCTPPFRKFDDHTATESWAYLFVPYGTTTQAWERIIKRSPRCVEWTEAEIRSLVDPPKVERTLEIVRKINSPELMRFKVGLDGLGNRVLGAGDSAVAILGEGEKSGLEEPQGFYRAQLETASRQGARIGLIFCGSEGAVENMRRFVSGWKAGCQGVFVRAPKTDFLLDGVTRAGLKMMLNALSTCTMVRLGRVMGNYMIWVVPSNLKLIDRSTRYIQRLTELDYKAANHLLFEVIEFVEPRMKADQAYPPVVGVSVMRARHQLQNQEAERRLLEEL
jgi:N-acetylmuramic acid 6-phosphate etherase